MYPSEKKNLLKKKKAKTWCNEKSILTEWEDRKSGPGQVLWTEMRPLSPKSDIEVPAPKPQNVTIFGNKNLKEVIKLRLLRQGPSPV